MRLLVLGGTVFVGRALTDAALAAGHEVMHFNRGRSPDARVRTLVGDRTRELPFELRTAWDAVLDTSGYLKPGSDLTFLPRGKVRSDPGFLQAPRAR